MPENNKGGWFSLTGLGILAGVGLAGWGLYELIQWSEKQDIIMQEYFNEYFIELQDLDDFQAAIAASGRDPTEFEQAMLDQKVHQMQFKEWVMKEHSQSWIDRLVHDIERLADQWPILLGISLAPIAGIIIVQIARAMWRRRPPKPPNWKDPKTGVPAATPEALKVEVKKHEANRDPAALANAQAVFNQQPSYAKEVMALEAGVGARAYKPWITLSDQQIIMLAYGMAFAVGLWFVAPAVGPAAALLLI